MGVIWASEAEHVEVAISFVNINPKQWKLPQSRFRTSAGWCFTWAKQLSSRPTLAKARGEPGPITTGGDHGAPLSRGPHPPCHFRASPGNPSFFVKTSCEEDGCAGQARA